MNKILQAAAFVTAVLAASFCHADETSLRATLAIKYPQTPIKTIEKTPIPGVYQIVMGKNIVYAAEDGRYFFFGSLYDMQTQTDLTANKREQASKVDIASIPLANAIVTVKGKGTRKLIVFTDPDCPYCKALAKTLDSMDDITVYNMLFPIDDLHPDASRKAKAIYCSKDSGRTLTEWLVRGIAVPQAADCVNPIADNVALAAKLGLNGTPMVLAFDGRLLPGAADRTKLDEFLTAR